MINKQNRKNTIQSRTKPLSSFSDIFSLSSGLKSGWKIVSGIWSSSSGSLTSSSAASAYPILIKDMINQAANVFLKNPTNGSNVAFWVTDSGNWWAAGINQEAVSCDCVPYSICNGYGCTGYGCNSSGCCAYGCISTGCISTGCTSYGCVLSGCLGYTCTGYAGSYCIGYTCSGGYGCAGYGCSNYGCTESGCTNSGCISSGCCGYGCTSTGCTSYANGQTCSTCYPRSIRILKSISGVVSTVTSSVISSVASSIRVKTLSNAIEIKAYSDTSGTTQIDSTVSYTATGSTQTKKYGLLISPASYSQGSTVGEINIIKN